MSATTRGVGTVGRFGGLVLLTDALWLLVGGRWASYVGIPHRSVFLTDIAFGVGILMVVVDLVSRRAVLTALTNAPWYVYLPSALGVLACLRFALTPELSTNALRDLAPYAYAFVAGGVFLSRPREQRSWDRAVGAALVFHAAWVSAALAWPSVHEQWHLYRDAYVFVTRSDFDIAVCGVGAGWALTKISRRRWPISAAAVAFVGWNAWLASVMWSRAGLIAAFAAAASAALLPRVPAAARSRRSARKTLAAGAVLVAVGVGAVFLTSAGQRFTDLITTPGGASAGTVAGRERAWPLVIDYTMKTPTRAVFGVGFGPNFLAESHAIDHLGGDRTLRSPHDYEVGTYARLGLPGVVLTLALTFVGFWLAGRALMQSGSVLAVSGLVLIAVPLIAAFGVVLEAPFGAIPYFAAFGYAAAALPHRKGLTGARRRTRPATAA